MNMNTFKKITAVLLCFFLIGFSLTAYADEAEEALNYVVLGDSISKGSGITNSDEACFGRIIADTNGYNYVNYGVDGLESSGLLGIVQRDDVYRSILNADIISISIGGNNYRHAALSLLFGGVMMQIGSAFDRVLDPFYDDFCNIISIIHDANPDALILVQTLYNPSTGVLRSAFGYAIDKLNECFYRYDSENPGIITIADVATELDGHAQSFAIIHPTAKGNEEIARFLLGILYDLGLGKNTEPVIRVKGRNTLEYTAACILNPTKLIPAAA